MHGLAFLAVKSQHRWMKSVLKMDGCCMYAFMSVRMCNFSPSHPVTGLTLPDHAWDCIDFPARSLRIPFPTHAVKSTWNLADCLCPGTLRAKIPGPSLRRKTDSSNQLPWSSLVKFHSFRCHQLRIFFFFDNSDSLDGSFLPRSVLQKGFLKQIM